MVRGCAASLDEAARKNGDAFNAQAMQASADT